MDTQKPTVQVDTSTPFTLFHIPLILFEGISDEFGGGDKGKKRGYQIKPLNEKKVGFPGVIGFREHDGGTLFVLWPYFSNDLGSINEPRRVLTISANEMTGATCFGENSEVHNFHVSQVISAQVCKGDFFPLDCVVNPFIRWIWEKAEELQKHKSCQVAKSFWKRNV